MIIEKRIEMNGNAYKVVMLPTGALRFFVMAGYNWRSLYTPKIIAKITAALVEAAHAEALELVESQPARDAETFNKRVNHAIKIAARDHGVELHAADVIEWANGDIYFNFTKAAKELAEAAKEAAPVEVEGVANIAEAAGLFDLWELFDRSPMKLHIDNLEMHYVDALNDEKAGGDAATAARRLFGFCEGDSLTYAFNAVCNQAREDLQIHIEASHDEALAIEAERALEANWRKAQDDRAEAREMQHNFQLSGLFAKRQAIEAAHAEALEENEDRAWRELPDALLPPVAEVVPDCIKQPEPRNVGGRPRKALTAITCNHTGPITIGGEVYECYVVALNNGKRYIYTTGIKRLQLICGGKSREYFKVIRNERIQTAVEQSVAEFQA